MKRVCELVVNGADLGSLETVSDLRGPSDKAKVIESGLSENTVTYISSLESLPPWSSLSLGHALAILHWSLRTTVQCPSPNPALSVPTSVITLSHW